VNQHRSPEFNCLDIGLKRRNHNIANPPTSSLPGEGQHHARLLLFGASSYQLGLLKSILETYGCESLVLTTTAELVESRQYQPELVIMLMDHKTPWEVTEQQLQMVRELYKQPPLLLIAPCDNPGLRQRNTLANVEDFLCLPLQMEELLLRLQACLSRWQASAPSGGGYPCVERRHGERRKSDSGSQALFQINARTKEVLVQDETIALSPKEYELLSLLGSDPGKVFSNKAILDHLWPGESKATATDVQQYIHRLRIKVEKDPTRPCYIQTVKGFGYRLTDQETD
jgi:DNA-binding response OmpR family regulator